MRKLIGSFFAFVLMISSLAGVAAQEGSAAYGEGIGSSATLFNDRGEAVATVEITDLIEDWNEYEEGWDAQRGYLYYAVAITVTNLQAEDIDVYPGDFSIVDSLGLDVSHTRISAAEDATMGVMADVVTLAEGESTEMVIVYELFSDVEPALLSWTPERSQMVLFYLGDGSLEVSSVVHGLNTPATASDDLGNEISTIEVTGVTDNWDEHEPNREPERGTRYVAVDFAVTNVSDSEIQVSLQSIGLIDNEGAINQPTNYRAVEDAETQVMTTNEDVPAGETLEGRLVFQLYNEVEPVGLMWTPQSRLMNVVILEDGTGTDAASDEMTSPDDDVDEEVQATPAA